MWLNSGIISANLLTVLMAVIACLFYFTSLSGRVEAAKIKAEILMRENESIMGELAKLRGRYESSDGGDKDEEHKTIGNYSAILEISAAKKGKLKSEIPGEDSHTLGTAETVNASLSSSQVGLVSSVFTKSQLRNPTFDELKAFLEDDQTDKKLYDKCSFDCKCFSLELRDNARDVGLRAAFVSVNYGGKVTGHAFNAFHLADLDRIVFIEPQRDSVVYAVVGKSLCKLSIGSIRREGIDTSGNPQEFYKPMRMCNFFDGDLFSFNFYEVYQQRCIFLNASREARTLADEFLELQRNAYDSDRQAYVEATDLFNARLPGSLSNTQLADLELQLDAKLADYETDRHAYNAAVDHSNTPMPGAPTRERLVKMKKSLDEKSAQYDLNRNSYVKAVECFNARETYAPTMSKLAMVKEELDFKLEQLNTDTKAYSDAVGLFNARLPGSLSNIELTDLKLRLDAKLADYETDRLAYNAAVDHSNTPMPGAPTRERLVNMKENLDKKLFDFNNEIDKLHLWSENISRLHEELYPLNILHTESEEAVQSILIYW